MLFLDSKVLNHQVDADGRIRLLQELQDRDLQPLIRSFRTRCFSDLLLGSEKIGEMEVALASWTESNTDEPFISGDIFPFHDYLLYLIFERDDSPNGFVNGGIVYQTETLEPFRKLDSFCHEVRSLLMSQEKDMSRGNVSEFPKWETGNRAMPQGFRTFIEKQDADSLYTSLRKETMSKRILAASRLEDKGARLFLRTARNAHQEGYAVKLLSGESHPGTVPIEGLEDVGLVEREVQVSCRKTGHALFRLPNADALAVVTVSDATCSECGSPVADENVEEVIAPTELATSLLEDGSWLVSRLHFLLRHLGVPEREIAVGPSEGTGFGQMMANICGESFLIATRDGDLTPAFARWVIDLEIDTEASHLVLVATGRIHREAGMLLRNHSRRRVSGGQDFEMIIADDVTTAGRELEGALERVSHRIIADQLCVLDSSVGMSVGRLVLTKFQLLTAEKKNENEAAVVEPAPEWSSPAAPLTLTAAASSQAAHVVDAGPEPVTVAPEQTNREPDQSEDSF
ncbi:MAG TPA: hypothetical protein VGQ39_00355 [Pyrinomonadaceae bacterium]|jgi:hypothetical protein|nr:hypothetical protein [Pyrinomonadaceae bacterium]